jgi:hemolysin activation/secretion protein
MSCVLFRARSVGTSTRLGVSVCAPVVLLLVCFVLWGAAAAVTVAAGITAAPPVPERSVPAPEKQAPQAPVAEPKNDPILSVSRFVLRYDRPVQGQPPLTDLYKLDLRLGQVGGVFSNYEPGRPVVDSTLASLSSGGVRRFHASAIREIVVRIRQYYQDHGFVAVYIAPASDEVDNQSKDKRPSGKTDLTLVVFMGIVERVRTVGSGERVTPETRIDNPLHTAIRNESPVSPEAGKSLLRKDLLDQYVFWLNRQPGRRVDIAISQADTLRPGDVVLDYLVAENKPWSVIAQVSNTGTRQTNTLRERFGFTDNQLTNRDDIFSINYTTSSFDEKSQTLEASYEAPLFHVKRTRWRVYADYDAFTASDLGTGFQNFIGEQYGGGGELAVNLWQQQDRFVDTFGGVQLNHIRTNLTPSVPSASTTGEALVSEPYIGFRAARETEKSDFSATISGRWGFASSDSLDLLGRTKAENSWPLLQAEVSESFFLEPLFNPAAFSRNQGTLAHEISLAVRGQSSVGRRLIPQEQEAVGGLYTVRGYPESIVAGDSVAIGSAEYRFHLPRSLPVEKDPSKTPLFNRPFRWSPQEPYGRPDWDLLFRAFFDAGLAHSNKNGSQIPEPTDQPLFGTGLGMEFQFSPARLPYVDVRAEWGHTLKAVDSGGQHVSSSSDRFHFIVTLLY